MAYDKTLFNRTPYYDDFEEDKKFLRMLFRPGYAVQARELTQAQTILQNQIQRFGDHIFEEGSRVLGGEVASQNAYYLRVQRKTLDQLDVEKELVMNQWSDFSIKQNNAGVMTEARVLEIIEPSGTFDDYYVFIIQFISGSEFAPGGLIDSTNPSHNLFAKVANLAENTTDASVEYGIFGIAKVSSVNDGIFYSNGYFVKNEFQTLSPYTTDRLLRRDFTFPTTEVGFTVKREIVTPEDDPTLRDPANGTYNYNAPGANRYKLDLDLSFIGQSNYDAANFISLLTYSEGKVTRKNVLTQYSALEDTLARRTFDESGSYTVRPFELDLREHLLSGSNRGVFSSEAGGVNSKAVSVLNPGKAYIFGYEFETQSPEYVSLEKTRDSSHQQRTTSRKFLESNLGPYCVGNVLGSINQNDGSVGAENQIRGFINLLSQLDNGVEGKVKVRFYYREWVQDADQEGNFVYAGTAHVHHIVKDDELWMDREINEHAQQRRWSSNYRFYLSDLDRTELARLRGVELDDAVDLDKMATWFGSPASFENYESYMVIADDDLDDLVYPPEQFNPADVNASSYDPIWKRWIAGGKVFGGDSYDETFKAFEQFDPAGGENEDAQEKFLFDSLTTPSLVYELPEGSVGQRVEELEFSTQIKFNIDNDSIVLINETPEVRQVSLNLSDLGLDQFTFAGAISGSPQGQTVVNSQDKGKYYILTVEGESGGNWGTEDDAVEPQFAAPVNLDEFDLTISDNGKTLIITKTGSGTPDTDDQGLNPNHNYVLIATVNYDNDVERIHLRTKEKKTHTQYIGGSTSGVGFAANSEDLGGFPRLDSSGNYFYELPHSDVLKITSINEVLDSGEVSIINDFIFDNGQRDTEYDYGRLYVKNQVKNDYVSKLQLGDGNVGRDNDDPRVFVVKYEFFDHAGEGPICVNSYFSDQYLESSNESSTTNNYIDNSVDTISNISFSEIPVYTSPVSGETLQLSNCIDFRFRRPTKTFNPGDNILNIPRFPAMQSYVPRNILSADEFSSSHNYFLPRIDKIVVTKRLSDEETTFDIIRGIPSLDPVPPDDREDSMTLYQLTIPPYVFNVDDIRTKFIENKRYTMRDVGRIEDRVSGLEFFSTLTDLEQKTTSETFTGTQQDQESDQVILVKNAILVDSFRGHGVGDVANNDYRCAIDFETGTLRPSFVATPFDLNGITIGNGITFDAHNIARIDHTGPGGSTAAFVSQLKANTTIKANPFYLTNWMGKLDISPYGDFWWDINYRPVVRVNTIGEADAWKSVTYENPGDAGKGFGSQWNDWQSMWYGLEYSNEDDTQSAVFDTITRARTSREDQLLPKKYEDQETSIRRSTETISQKKTRVGVQIRSIPDRIKKIIGTKIVDVSVVPFIRPKTLTINADGLKPNTNVYCFFDGVNVTESCLVGGTGPSAGTFRTGTEGSNAGAIRDLKFTIPAGQYESGEKLFRIIDSENNDVEFATTSAEATYYAQGLKLSRDSGSVSVRPPVLRRQTVSSERVVSNVFSRETVFDSNSNTQYIDPLAQTFTVSSNEYPGGVFLDSVDVWFKSKHATLPITLQIRPTVQGAPHSSIILPFSEVVKYPDDISVNDLSTGPLNSSKFEFKTPVFLEPGEYALCFVTNTGDYELFMGEVGELDIASQQSISSELYVNNLYEPQNGSVALPNATRDLMVQINKCVYNIVPQTCKFNGPALGTTADVDMLYLQAKQLRLTGADIEYDLEVKGASRSSFSQTIDSNQNIKLDEKRSIKNSTDISLDATLFPTTQDVAPMIDVSQSSIIGISNFIDGSAEDDVEQDPSSGGQVGCKTRYITRRVNLLNSSAGSDPNAFQVILDKAGSGTVDVYLKAAAAGDTTPFDEQPYIKLRKITSGVDDDLSESDFKQLRYEAAENQMGARFGDTNGFNVFAVKVCMTTTDTTNPPLVKDLRAVALTRPRS